MINLFMYDSSVERCAVLRIMFPLLRFWNSVRLWFWYSLQHQLFVCVFFRSLTPFFDTHPKKNAVNYAVSNAHAIFVYIEFMCYTIYIHVCSHIICISFVRCSKSAINLIRIAICTQLVVRHLNLIFDFSLFKNAAVLLHAYYGLRSAKFVLVCVI